MYSGRLRRRCARSASALRLADHVRHQPLLARRVLARHHHASRTLGVPAQRGLDLAQLDAEAADLHLVVERGPGTRWRRPPATAPGRRCGTAARRPAAENGSGTKRSAVSSGRPR